MATYPKFQVFFIGHIEELAVLLVFYRQSITPLILPRIIHHEHDRHHAGERSCHNDANLCGNILRGIGVSKSQWSDDVPNACVFRSVFDAISADSGLVHLQKDMRRMAFIVTFFV